MPNIAIPEVFEANPSEALYQHAPVQMAAGMAFSRAVYQETRLPYRVVEAARYRTAQINGCQMCQNWRAVRDLGGYLESVGGDFERSFAGRVEQAPDERFYAAVEGWRDSDLFSEAERIAIEYAERMGRDPHSFEADEEFWSRVHAHFTDAEIVDLTLALASWIAMGRVTHVLGADPVVCGIMTEAA